MIRPHFRIPLFDHRGDVRAYALVDGEDLDWVLAHRWMYSNGYVVRHCRLGPGRQTRIRLHRELMALPRHDPREVDHRNRDPLDNRRSNLRVVTSQINAQNKPSSRTSTSRYRGVSWDGQRQRWIAQAKLDGKNYNLGRFVSEESAAEVVSEWRALHMPGALEEVVA